MKNKMSGREGLFVIFVTFLVSPVIWALCTIPMWRWFVAPVTQFQTPNLGVMIGLSFMVSMFKGSSTSSSNELPNDWRAKFYGNVFIVPPLMLGLAWLVHNFLA